MKFFICLLFLIPLCVSAGNGISNSKIEFQFQQAEVLFQNNKPNQANEILRNMMKYGIDSISNSCLYKIASNHIRIQAYDSTTYYLFKLISKKSISKQIKIKSLILLGLTYNRNNSFDKSVKYFKEAQALNAGNDKVLESQIYCNLGDLYFNNNKYQKAIYYFLKDLSFQKEKISEDYQIALSNIGAAYIALKKPDKALPYIKESQELAIKLEDRLGESISINNLATIYRDLNKQDSALFYYKKALSMVDELGSKEEKKTILYNLSELYEKKGKLSEAINYYKQYTAIKDELFNTEKNEFIIETQEKYQAAERKKDLAEMKLKVQKKDASHKQFIFTFTLISLGLGIVLISIILWLRWKSIKQKNEAKIQIISATLMGEEKQKLKISQELHDDLGGILGMSRMLFTRGKQYFTETNQELYNRIDSLLIQANNKSRAISHDLFSPNLKQFGLFSAITEQVSNIQLSNPDLEINFSMEDIRVNEQLELNCFRITQELFTNTIKYANATIIDLHISVQNETLTYLYQDNGKGFDLQNVKKGVGLNSIEARVKSFGGELTYGGKDIIGFGINIKFFKINKF